MMQLQFLKYGVIVLLIITALLIFGFCLKGGKPFKYLLINAAAGIAAFAVIDLLSFFTGVYIPVNPYTAGGAAMYGVPCVIGFLVLPLILK